MSVIQVVDFSEVNTVSDKELVATTVSRYADLLRIKQASDRDAEIETQESELRVILESMGVTVDDIKVRS